MKSTKAFTLIVFLGMFMAFATLYSCQKEDSALADRAGTTEIIKLKGPTNPDNAAGKGKGKKNDDPAPDPPTNNDPFVTTYQLYQADDADPLYRFSISQSGQLMLLESDPTVAAWGSNFWGTWADPFPYANNEVNYIKGLTNTTYRFQQIAPNTIDVTTILIVQPYTGGAPTTTESHPGIYMLVE